MTRTPSNTFLYIACSRLVVHLTGQVRQCLAALNDQQIWWRANEGSNTIGNLVLHCAGSTRYYIGHVVVAAISSGTATPSSRSDVKFRRPSCFRPST